MGKIKIYIESSVIPLTEVTPLLSGDFTFTKKEGKIYYNHELDSKVKFKDLADWILLQDQIPLECDEVSIYIDTLCGGSYSRYWEGTFKIFGSTVDYDLCWIEVETSVEDDYTCLEEKIKEEQNLYSSGSTVSTTGLGGTLEEQECININASADCTDFYFAVNNPLDTCLATPANWCLAKNTVLFNGFDSSEVGISCDDGGSSDNLLEQTTKWHREVITIPCVGGIATPPPFGTGWALISEDCGGAGTSTWWRCPLVNTNGEIVGDYTRGRNFSGFIEAAVTNLGCGLTVKSDFFDINPLGDAPTNSKYTYAENYLHNLTIHQKSDIKRKNAQNGSTAPSWNAKGKDLFGDLEKIFNIRYAIASGVLIIEHFSFFNSTVGADLSNAQMLKRVKYKGENIRLEKYYWSEENSTEAFKSEPITYDCGEEEKEQRCVLFSTDIAYTEDENNENKINDNGFMIISNALYLGNLIIIDNNDPLTWDNLLAELHTDARPYKSGKINGVQQNFDSWIPYIIQDSFKIDHCCDQTFNPIDLITTDLGNGTVDKGTHNVYTDKLKLELIY